MKKMMWVGAFASVVSAIQLRCEADAEKFKQQMAASREVTAQRAASQKIWDSQVMAFNSARDSILNSVENFIGEHDVIVKKGKYMDLETQKKVQLHGNTPGVAAAWTTDDEKTKKGMFSKGKTTDVEIEHPDGVLDEDGKVQKIYIKVKKSDCVDQGNIFVKMFRSMGATLARWFPTLAKIFSDIGELLKNGVKAMLKGIRNAFTAVTSVIMQRPGQIANDENTSSANTQDAADPGQVLNQLTGEMEKVAIEMSQRDDDNEDGEMKKWSAGDRVMLTGFLDKHEEMNDLAGYLQPQTASDRLKGQWNVLIEEPQPKIGKQVQRGNDVVVEEIATEIPAQLQRVKACSKDGAITIAVSDKRIQLFTDCMSDPSKQLSL
jgi:hypothetical protein